MSEVETLVPRPKYLEKRLDLFNSYQALEWYIRQNRDELVDAGALLLHRNRWLVNPDKFDAFVLAEAKRAAKRAA